MTRRSGWPPYEITVCLLSSFAGCFSTRTSGCSYLLFTRRYFDSKEAEDDLKELQFIIHNFYGDAVHFTYDTIRSSDVAQSINSYILRQQPDILALCSVHRNFVERLFHKSVIKNISAISSYPVFVFHP